MIRFIEEISFNALPALRTVYYDGWILRFADGYTRRANSVQVLYPSTLPLDEKIAYCEELYRAAGLPVVFKLTDAAQPSNLNAILTEHDYAMDASTSVRTLDLANYDPQPTYPHVTIEATPQEEWVGAFGRLNTPFAPHVKAMRRVVNSIVPRAGYVALRQPDSKAIVAVALAVVERGYVGMYDVAVEEKLRGQGLGRQLMLHALAWGKANGAHTAYLQVFTTNEPAVRLYSSVGFEEQYRYWYRQKA
ncbi:MAG: GNAT family N-acetyltransferase [Burkholderiales bacterium]|nr:GNAT family N-acetyltransferase [Anaerolineae bacterium]